jgi:hypothetical protein
MKEEGEVYKFQEPKEIISQLMIYNAIPLAPKNSAEPPGVGCGRNGE